MAEQGVNCHGCWEHQRGGVVCGQHGPASDVKEQPPQMDEMWADEGGMSLRVTAIDAGHVRVEIKAGIMGEVLHAVTLGRWRWDRLVAAMKGPA